MKQKNKMEAKQRVFKAVDHGFGQINLMEHMGKELRIMLPTEIHHKEDGTITNEPSFCIVMTAPLRPTVAGEISLKMLNEGLNEMGYEIVRRPEMYQRLIEKIESMKDDSGRKGCKYGDTEFDSLSVVYGYNSAIDNVINELKKIK